jgi:ATP diphosphatase
MLNNKASITKLRWIMAQLRDPATGCPWDIKQDFASITAHTLEEAYEHRYTINSKSHLYTSVM